MESYEFTLPDFGDDFTVTLRTPPPGVGTHDGPSKGSDGGDVDPSGDHDSTAHGADSSQSPHAESSEPSRASQASLDVSKDMALTDEGLLGIGTGPSQRTVLFPPKVESSSGQGAISTAAGDPTSKGGPLQRIITRSQRPTQLVNEQDGQPKEDQDSMKVHHSARDSAYSATPIEDQRGGLNSPAVMSDDNADSRKYQVNAETTLRLVLPSTAPQQQQNRREHRSSPSAQRSAIQTTGASQPPAAHDLATDSSAICCMCQTAGPDRFFCNICKMLFCGVCWDRLPMHRRTPSQNTDPHERTDYSVAKKVQHVLNPELSDDAREKLHEDDINTTWFGVHRQKGEIPLFREYGRYVDMLSQLKTSRTDPGMMSPMSLHFEEHNELMYPSLVSFVGETGAGKSTVVKLLIDLNSCEGETPQTPIVGAVGEDHLATSEDVHLYLDPETSRAGSREAPIFYADCEGLNGGGREPVGAFWRQKFERHPRRDGDADNEKKPKRLKYVSQRVLQWANKERTQTREFAVAHLYPRLLYTFSDAIVFVLKNPRVIESVLERLLSWAEAALEQSSNQPILPCAIIVLNASDNNIPEELWNADNATHKLMKSMSEVVHRKHAFKKYVNKWHDRGQPVDTVEQLLALYYTSIRVVRIPTTGRPNLIYQQVQTLSKEIRNASKTAQERKKKLRMLLDADGLALYLQFAMDHFARSLDAPFDFVQASFTYSPIPMDFGGNILKLAIQVMESWKDQTRAVTIFEELSYVVASCILFDVARNKIKGTPTQIFPRYLEHLDNALENFCDRHWPCEYVGKGGRCVNVRSGHQKGHQLKTGKLLSAGQYQSEFSYRNDRDKFENEVYWHLFLLTETVQTRAKKWSLSELQAAVQVHKDILPSFLEHASRPSSQALASHTICFTCLKGAPEHALPCGHILCTECLMTFGMQRYNLISMRECPLEPGSQFSPEWTVQFKPENCGMRVLSLDGAGVRGAVQLEILKEIERQLGANMDIRKFFDLIVGTSAGAVVALELAVCNWTLQKCIEQFDQLCDRAFAERLGLNVPVGGRVVELYNQSKYRTQSLVDYLQSIFTDHRYLFGGPRGDSGTTGIKIAVTAASSAGNAVVLANYNRLSNERLPYIFHRSETPQAELMVWEVARAAFAAPKMFKPYSHKPSSQAFSDGSIEFSNPIRIAEYERRLICPSLRNEEPDVVVSIGAGFSDGAKNKTPRKMKKQGKVARPRSRIWLMTDHDGENVPPSPEESTWQNYMRSRRSDEALSRYARFDARLTGPLPKFDEVQKMEQIKEETEHSVKDDPKIRELAKRLVASCFYFDLDSDPLEHQDTQTDFYEVCGNLRCRLTSKSDVAGLGNFILQNANAGHDPYFIVQQDRTAYEFVREFGEGCEDDQSHRVQFAAQTIDQMRNEGLFRMEEMLRIRSTTRSVRTMISLCYTRDAAFPISRFPRFLFNDGPAKRFSLTAKPSARWASRPPNHTQRIKEWMPQPSNDKLRKKDLIERYCHPDHFFGRASAVISMDSSAGHHDTESGDAHSSTTTDFSFNQSQEDVAENDAHRTRENHTASAAPLMNSSGGTHIQYTPYSPPGELSAVNTRRLESTPVFELPTQSTSPLELMSRPVFEMDAQSQAQHGKSDARDPP